jgi:hypothetical protein
LESGLAVASIVIKQPYIFAVLIPPDEPSFERDLAKNRENGWKYEVRVYDAQAAVLDANHATAEGLKQSQKDKRYC